MIDAPRAAASAEDQNRKLFALRHGRVEGDKYILDRKTSRRLIEALNEELRLAKQVLDKGGVTVVEGEDTIITAYNRNQPMARLSGGHHHV